MDKQQLRQHIKLRRHTYHAGIHEKKVSLQFCQTFQNYVQDQKIVLKDKIIALYYPFGDEASPLSIMDYLLKKAYTVALPKMYKEDVTFALYTEKTLLQKNSFGFYEPMSGSRAIPNILILPLLAFDQFGHRLGYGKGHYDKAFQQIAAVGVTPLCLGVAYPCQAIDILPVEEHDQKLDAVLHPDAYITFKKDEDVNT